MSNETQMKNKKGESLYEGYKETMTENTPIQDIFHIHILGMLIYEQGKSRKKISSSFTSYI